jgi:hypothetical protein
LLPAGRKQESREGKTWQRGEGKVRLPVYLSCRNMSETSSAFGKRDIFKIYF